MLVILLIDNYDSFVHNLARYFQRLGQATHVVRNDRIDATGVAQLEPSAIVLSPGPCGPAEAGCSLDVVRAFWQRLPILGICLGHQTIAAALGGKVVRAQEPMHGRTSVVFHDGRGLFAGIASPLVACRYHSLVVDEATLPDSLEVSAKASNAVMAIRHRERPVFGVQFHPESILTEHGFQMLANFLRLARLECPPFIPDIDSELRQPAACGVALPSEPITF